MPAGTLKVSYHKRIIAPVLCGDGIADDRARTAMLYDGMGVGIVRRNAMEVGDCSGIDYLFQVFAQAIPVCPATFVISVALVPDPVRRCYIQSWRS